MVTVFKGTARLASPDFSARLMISVAASGWLSHHSASAASVRNVGIAIGFLGMLISLRSTSVAVAWSSHRLNIGFQRFDQERLLGLLWMDAMPCDVPQVVGVPDRKSTRLNSSHLGNSY